MHALHGLVDSMLTDALTTNQTGQRSLDEVLNLAIVQLAIVLGIQILEHLHLLDETLAHIGCQIEVKGWDSLTTVHLVLHGLHADTTKDGGCLNALCRTALSVASLETILQDSIQWMLNTGQRLGGIVVLIVNVQIVVLHGILHLVA